MRKNNIKLSVVIRAHNEARWIKQCINRLNEQSILPDEIILIDNNSTDGTVQLEKYRWGSTFGNAHLDLMHAPKFSKSVSPGLVPGNGCLATWRKCVLLYALRAFGAEGVP